MSRDPETVAARIVVALKYVATGIERKQIQLTRVDNTRMVFRDGRLVRLVVDLHFEPPSAPGVERKVEPPLGDGGSTAVAEVPA